jgi:hypothetical protein
VRPFASAMSRARATPAGCSSPRVSSGRKPSWSTRRACGRRCGSAPTAPT